MARNDLLVALVRAGASGDNQMLHATVEAIVAEERAKKNETLAAKLTRALGAKGHLGSNNRISSLPSPGRELVYEVEPRIALNELIFTDQTRTSVEQLIEEQSRADLLRSHGLQPRHRVLLAGPPGNGKTALAEAIAEALALPFLIVRYEALIGSFLGETAQRLAQLFAFARTLPCVLFFDEFDVVGKERGDAHETGEIKRVVSNLLLQIDALPSHVIAVAATNHSELLDSAVWRRFQIRLEMPVPSEAGLKKYFEGALATLDKNCSVDPSRVVARIGPISFAEARDFLQDVRRRYVLSLGKKTYELVLDEQLELWAARAKPNLDANRPNETAVEIRSAETGKPKKRRAPSNTASRKVSKTAPGSPPRPQVPTPEGSAKSRRRPRSAEK